MPVLNTNSIDAVKLGSTNIDAIYEAGVKIWPAQVPGLLAEYRFAIGNELDDTSGNGRTASTSNDPAFVLSYVVSSARANSGVSCFLSPSIQLPEFTAEGWISPVAPVESPSEKGTLFYMIGDGEIGSPSVGVPYSGNSLTLRVLEADATSQETPIANIPVGTAGETSGVFGDYNQWVHLAITANAGTVKAWVAGQLAATITRAFTTPVNAQVLRVCQATTGQGMFRVAGCRFWDSEKYTANFTPYTGLLNP